jgi:carboxyl-terminal processing protease
MAELAREAGPEGLKGYVVDLRSNPGGLLDQSIVVAGAFLSGGVVVSTRSRVDSNSYNADLPNPSGSLPVVVLINEGSASASEIVAGAIKDRARGVIVGQKSFGKGSVQTAFEMGSGDGMKLTTALYYTPSGRTVESGILPDVEAVDDPETEDIDEALDVALDLLMDMAGGHTVLWNSGTTIE